jgi:hypothetical protein
MFSAAKFKVPTADIHGLKFTRCKSLIDVSHFFWGQWNAPALTLFEIVGVQEHLVCVVDARRVSDTTAEIETDPECDYYDKSSICGPFGVNEICHADSLSL